MNKYFYHFHFFYFSKSLVMERIFFQEKESTKYKVNSFDRGPPLPSLIFIIPTKLNSSD